MEQQIHKHRRVQDSNPQMRQTQLEEEICRLRTELERVEAEAHDARNALQSSEEFKSRLIACSRDCIKVLDLEGRLVFMNEGGMQVLELCDLGPLLNKPWIDVWESDCQNAVRVALEAAKAGGIGHFVGSFPTTRTKQMRWWDVVITPVRDANGQAHHLLSISRDITDQYLAEETFRSLVVGTASATGGEFFCALVRHTAAALRVRYAFVSECDDQKHAKVLAIWKDTGFSGNFEFDIVDTPCEKVLMGETQHYREGLQAIFPHDKGLSDWSADSYLGIPMLDPDGRVIGHIAVLDDKPMDFNAHSVDLLKIFASRAAAELKRQKAESLLQVALEQVRTLQKRAEAENIYLREEIRNEHNFEEMIGQHPALLALLKKIERVASTETTVLVQGETGTGKELIVRAVHNRSKRSGRPLVKVNCAAIPAGLVESELFGHVKGAFTGALERRIGRFEIADGGTLFLDEVGELPLDAQAKLLRTLQEQEFEPVGSNRTVHVDVRIIAATNRDLLEAVNAGRFRADLFYRINVLLMTVPPLRARSSDIPHLVTFFLQRFSKRSGKPISGVSVKTMNFLMRYAWPGNVRELQNVIERGVALCQGDVLKLDADLLPVEGQSAYSLDSTTSDIYSSSLLPLEEVERRHIVAVLKTTNGVIEGVKGAAKILRLHPNTLRSRMKKLNIGRDISHEIS
ncbi:MAG TPA: sigma 54-interacting transcriptional regulator [Candidatus Deferrimicrobiaceae bacterium]|nr:sigma 54-interacting transcriptional regulator [Candidatus Deferrimicrobiaceae bacterium]